MSNSQSTVKSISVPPAFDMQILESMISKALDVTPDADILKTARAHQDALLKPPGSLGVLEDLAVWLAALQGTLYPRIDKRQCLIFAGNHGIVKNHPFLSAFPPDITAHMVASFHQKTAAVNQLCRHYRVELEVHASDLEKASNDFTLSPALNETQLLTAIRQGYDAVDGQAEIVCLGEMGIGNTTSATAMAYALYGLSTPIEKWCGRGTGIDNKSYWQKCLLIEKTVQHYQEALAQFAPHHRPFAILSFFGGFEFASLIGALLKTRELLIPVMIDGFACSVAAAILNAVNSDLVCHTRISHCSQENGHATLLQTLDWQALLSLRMRLGEASGALVALGLCDAAVACHNGMGHLPAT